MRSKITILLSCLACAGQQRRVHISLEQLFNSSHDNSEKLLEHIEAFPQLQSARRAHAKGIRSPMNSLKGLLIQLREEDRLNMSSSRTDLPDDNASRAGLLAFSLSEILSGQARVNDPEMNKSDVSMKDSMRPQSSASNLFHTYAEINGLHCNKAMAALSLLGLIGWLCSCWLLRRHWKRAQQADGVDSSAESPRGCQAVKAGKPKTSTKEKKRRMQEQVQLITKGSGSAAAEAAKRPQAGFVNTAPKELARKEQGAAKGIQHARQDGRAKQADDRPIMLSMLPDSAKLGERSKDVQRFAKPEKDGKVRYPHSLTVTSEQQAHAGRILEAGAPLMSSSKNIGDDEHRKNSSGASAKKALRKAGRAEEKLHPIVEEVDSALLREVRSGAADGVQLEQVGSAAADDQAVSNLEGELCAEPVDLPQNTADHQLPDSKDQQVEIDSMDGLGQGDRSTEIAKEPEACFDDQVVDMELVEMSPVGSGADGHEAAFLQLSCKDRKHDVESAPTVASSSDLSSEVDGAVSIFDEDVAHDAPSQHGSAVATTFEDASKQLDSPGVARRSAGGAVSWASIVAGRGKSTSEDNGGDDEEAGGRDDPTASEERPGFWPSLSEASKVARPSRPVRETKVIHEEDMEETKAVQEEDEEDMEEDGYEYFDAPGTLALDPSTWGEGCPTVSEQPRLQALVAARVLDALGCDERDLRHLGCDEGDLQQLLAEEFEEEACSRPKVCEPSSSVSMLGGPLFTSGFQVYGECASGLGQHFFTDGVHIYQPMYIPIQMTHSGFAYKDRCDDDVWDSCWDSVRRRRRRS